MNEGVNMTNRACNVLMWGVVNCTITGGLFLVLLKVQNDFILTALMAFLWGMVLNSGIVAFHSNDDLLKKEMSHITDVPYILELQMHVSWVMMLYATGHLYTAWAWFMQVIAGSFCYYRVKRMETVK